VILFLESHASSCRNTDDPAIFDHVDLRVSDFAQARKFYDVFFRALGFPSIRAAETEVSYYAEGDRKTAPFIGLNEEPAHRGNANHFAFWADTEEEVNRLGAIIREAGAQNIEGPEYCHEYTPGYYAVFFEDADGNKWEICCRNARIR
jgi:catechol 2,3-dioxygenase-like lactoylglutathione lyase family enzyme